MYHQRPPIPLALAAAMLLAARAWPQTVATGIPDATAFGMYEHLFRHVVFLKHLADDKVAKGNTQTTLRRTYQAAANLTDAEAKLLESTSLNCVPTLNAIVAQARSTVQNAPAHTQSAPSSGGPSPAPRPELVTLENQRVAAVLACRNTLHEGFGDQRFALFEAFLTAHATTSQTSVRPMQPGREPTAETVHGGRSR